ncbi:MAG TPA: protein-L-isoaspartate(D-aspartate) O-methyltransferase [Candidatus Limnocylindrales bacterium]|nr:protein-L-isoaspartate(D-aspartate) O-methyltransferase [Candidatus Limnocylindrales bacterium]
MVDRQLRSRGLTDERVLAAMAGVPRERFVRKDLIDRAYDDDALPIEGGQSISQPYIVAWMTELLRVEPGMAVLEIGTGSGYQAAVLAAMGAQVWTLERLPDLAVAARERIAGLSFADRVTVVVADGSLGDPERAPHARIIVTAGAPNLPDPLLDQLAEGGRLVIPVGPSGEQQLVLVTREAGRLVERQVGACAFVPLIGAAGYRPGDPGPV